METYDISDYNASKRDVGIFVSHSPLTFEVNDKPLLFVEFLCTPGKVDYA